MYRHTSPRRWIALLVALTMLLAACGDDGESSTEPSGDDPPADDAPADDPPADDESGGDESGGDDPEGDALDDVEEMVDEMVDDLEEQQAAQGGGSATLVVGDQEWTFSPVLCAFGEDEIGQEGAEFVLSAIQDGMQMYASIDTFGHLVSLDDITDFENPSVSLSTMFGEEVIMLDGKNVTVEAGFLDNTNSDDPFATTPGTFTATCP